jgi:hypothetical protein
MLCIPLPRLGGSSCHRRQPCQVQKLLTFSLIEQNSHLTHPNGMDKRRVVPFILLTFAVSLLVSSSVRVVYACSCASLSPSQQFQMADAVFVGTVTNINAPSGPQANSAGLEQVTFDVSAGRKGSLGQTIVVSTSMSQGTCGYPFQVGRQYTVYTQSVGGQLETGLCAGTNLYTALGGQPGPGPNLSLLGNPLLWGVLGASAVAAGVNRPSQEAFPDEQVVDLWLVRLTSDERSH